MNLHTVAVAGLTSIALVACSPGSQYQLRMLEYANQLSVEPAIAGDHDYVVKVGNVGDVGYDPDDQEVRNEVALSAISAQCANPVIVGEDSIRTGTIPIQNKPAITYFIKIRC